MKKLANSLPYLKEYANLVFSPILSHAAVTIISPPLVGLTFVVRLIIRNISVLLPVHTKIINKTLFLWVDVSGTVDDTIESLVEELNYYLTCHALTPINKVSGWRGIEKAIEVLLHKDFEKILFIVEDAHLLTSMYSTIPQKLRKINLSFPTEVQFVFLTEEELGDQEVLRRYLKDLFPLYVSNIHYMPLLPSAEFRRLLEFRAHEVDLKIPSKDFNKIISISANHPAFMRILLREYKKSGKVLEGDVLLNNIEIKNLFLKTWNAFSKNTQESILKDQNYSNEFFEKTGLKKNNRWFSNYFIKFVTKMHSTKDYIQSNEALSLLTWQESQVYDYLQKNKGKIVSREDIAKMMWGELWNEKYSDWAIEQVISKMRKKVGFDKQVVIKTVPKLGYKLFVS
jgi:hypothetical protein